MKAILIIFIILTFSCEHKSNVSKKLAVSDSDPDQVSEIPSEVEFRKRFGSEIPKNITMEGVYRGKIGIAIIENIVLLTLCDQDDFLTHYAKAIDLDIGALGVKERVSAFGLHNMLFYTVRTIPEDKSNYSKWQKLLGNKLHMLLLRVDKLPNEKEFAVAKAAIFMGAADGFNGSVYQKMQGETDHVKIYMSHRNTALNYFKIFQ